MAPRFRPRLSPLEGRDLPAALLQVVNNSPYPAAARVDVYINNLLVPELTGLGFRQATPFLTQPSAVPLVVSVRKAGETAAVPPFSTQILNLAENSATLGVIVGDPAQAGLTASKFQIVAAPAARQRAVTAGKAEFAVFNGSPDALPLDVTVRGVGKAADDVPYPTLAPAYTALAPGKYALDVTTADGATRLGSYAGDLSGAADKAFVVLTSGFVAPPAGATANTFTLLAVAADGTTAPLTAATPPPARVGFAAGGVGKAILYDGAGKELFSVSPFGAAVETRAVAADVTADGVADLVVGSGPGVPPAVQVFDGATGAAAPGYTLTPFEATFTGGVFVAAGDLSGDGRPELVVTPDQGGGPVVAVYQPLSRDAQMAGFNPTLAPQVARFLGIEDPNFRGGARSAVGDLNADGRPDLVVAAGFGGGPRVAVFDGRGVASTPLAAGGLPPKLVGDFLVFEPTLRNGVYVAAGDLSGDGAADVLLGGGPGGGPRVLALDGRALTAGVGRQTPVANFFAADPNNRDGVRVAARELDGDARADVLVGLGSAGGPQVRGFRGLDLPATVTGGTPAAAFDLSPFPAGPVYVG